MPVEAAILLAGGQSRRMGRDKSRLPFGNGPMVARVYEALATVFPTILVVTPQPDFPVPGARCIDDRYPGNGPLEGLASGLEAMEASRALLCACDMPFLNPDLLRYLSEQAGTAEALVPCGPRGPEPLLAVYSRRVLPVLRGFLADGNRSATRFLGVIQARLLPFEEIRRLDPDGASFRNLNRPEDYDAALRELPAHGSRERP